MIEEIALENFKAFGEKQTISLAPLTLIYGQNSAGKSSIIQSLAMMKQSFEADRDEQSLKTSFNGGLVDLGSYLEILHEHNQSNSFHFSFTWRSNIEELTGNAFSRRRPSEIKLHQKEPLKCSCRIEFDSTPKDKIPYVKKWFFLVYSIEDDELLRIELCLDENGTKLVANVKNNSPLHYRLSDLFLSEKLLKNNYSWIKKNSSFVEELASQWVKYHVDESEAELQEHVAAEEQKLRASIQIYNDDFTIEEYRDYIIRNLLGSKLQFQGFQPLLNPNNDFNKTFENIIPFGMPKDFQRRFKSESRFFILSNNFSSFYDFSRYISMASEKLQAYLDRSRFIGPIRSQPHRFYASGGLTPKTVGYSGERTPDLILNNTEILKKTNFWLHKLEMGYQIEPQKLSQASLFELRLQDLRKSGNKKFRVTLKDVGFGISQVLPVIVQCIFSEGHTILIEQPELHIHPRLQADLADLFIFSMTERRNRLIIETHSEHLVLRISKQLNRRSEINNLVPFDEKLRSSVLADNLILAPRGRYRRPINHSQIKERGAKNQKQLNSRRKKIDKNFPDEYTPDPLLFSSNDVLVNYVSRGETSGSIVHQIRFTEDGKFKDKWPGGFFPERRREIIF